MPDTSRDAERAPIGAEIRTELEAYRSDPAFAAVVTEPFIRRMEIFGAALAVWGARINLTARPQDSADTAFHIVDSLTPLALVRPQRPQSPMERSFLSPLTHSAADGEGSDALQALASLFTAGKNVLDFGSGAGFPGLVLASACPAHFTLVEARHKRASFLKVAAAEMALDNVEILVGRLTASALTSRFDAVLSRASGPVGDFYGVATGVVNPDGFAILYANPSQRLDLAAAKSAGLSGYGRYDYSLRRHGTNVDRVLAIWQPAKKSP